MLPESVDVEDRQHRELAHEAVERHSRQAPRRLYAGILGAVHTGGDQELRSRRAPAQDGAGDRKTGLRLDKARPTVLARTSGHGERHL